MRYDIGDAFLKCGFNHDEIEVLKLMNIFDTLSKKYLGPHVKLLAGSKSKLENIRETKTWEKFKELHLIFKKIPAIDKEKFIEAQLYVAKKSGRGFKLGWLTTTNSVKRYIDFISKKREDNSDVKNIKYKEKCLTAINSTASFLCSLINKFKAKSFYDVFAHKNESCAMPASFIHIMTGDISYPYLSISKSYRKFYEDLDKDIKNEFPNPDTLASIRNFIKSDVELSNYCKHLFKQDCYL